MTLNSQTATEPHADAQTWEEALDRLEADLLLAEELLRHPDAEAIGTWTTPMMATPLPAYLLERARALVARQTELLVILPRAQERLRRQQALTSRIRQVTGRPTTSPVYIDASA